MRQKMENENLVWQKDLENLYYIRQTMGKNMGEMKTQIELVSDHVDCLDNIMMFVKLKKHTQITKQKHIYMKFEFEYIRNSIVIAIANPESE